MNLNELLQQQRFQEQMSNYQLWLYKADELVRVAKILDGHVDKDWARALKRINNPNRKVEDPTMFPIIQDIQMMLYSYALENYFKAIIVFTNPSICSTNELPEEIKKHNLIVLAKRAQFPINHNVDDIELLLRLERNATWQGRYPVPSSYRKISSIYRYQRRDYFG